MWTELWRDVPKDPLENLLYREELRDHARRDPRLQAAIRTACRDDILYYFNAWCWLFEPRPEKDEVTGKDKPMIIPFITWDHQDPVIVDTYEKLGYEDIGWNKTRGEGASWIACHFADHDWTFLDMATVGMVSRNEKYADNPEDSDSLFWKIDFQISMLPRWMVGTKDIDWKRSLTNHTLYNLRNGSMIAAYAATGDVASGGRKRWFLMDELAKFPKPADQDAMASTQPVTNSRLIVSTFKGAFGAYYDLMTDFENNSMLRCVLDWRDNKTKNRGLYRLINGVPVAVDPVNNPLLPNYDPPTPEVVRRWSSLRKRGFNLENNTRSEWYDKECMRAGATPENIAEELDRDPKGSVARYFLDDFHRIVRDTVKMPEIVGNFKFRPDSLDGGNLDFTFDRGVDGDFKLWCGLDDKNRPPRAPYALACDVAAGGGGTHSSNSTIFVKNLRTKEQVLEFASNSIEPSLLADLAMAIGYWFHTAFIAWEENGPGSTFTSRVIERRYPDYFKRVPFWKQQRNIISDPQPGWRTDTRTKEMMFGDLNMAVLDGSVIIRSHALMEEFHQYIREKHKIVHTSNPGDVATHGDRVIAACVCEQASRQRPQPKPGEEEKVDPNNPPTNTYAYRMQQRRAQEAWENDDCREREPGDLLQVSGTRQYTEIY